jgi:hypothetical protein
VDSTKVYDLKIIVGSQVSWLKGLSRSQLSDLFGGRDVVAGTGTGHSIICSPTGLYAHFSFNARYDGANWNREDTTKEAWDIAMGGGYFKIYYAPPGSNPITTFTGTPDPSKLSLSAAGSMLVSGQGLSVALLSDDVPSVWSVWEQWGSEEVSFSNPGIPVKIAAWLTGELSGPSTRHPGGRAKIQVSLNNGSSWTDGKVTRSGIEVDGPWDDLGYASLAAQHQVSGTPTALIRVRAMLYGGGPRTEGEPSECHFTEGTLQVLMTGGA